MLMDTLQYLSPFLPQLFRKSDLKVKKNMYCYINIRPVSLCQCWQCLVASCTWRQLPSVHIAALVGIMCGWLSTQFTH